MGTSIVRTFSMNLLYCKSVWFSDLGRFHMRIKSQKLKLPCFLRKTTLAILAFFWTLGLMLGILCSGVAGDTLTPLMRTAVSRCVSFSGLLTAVLLPFLLSMLALYLHKPWLFVPIAFLKAFLFSYTGFGVMVAFDSAGWLVRLLLMFSDCCTMPILFWFWAAQINGCRKCLLSIATPILLAAAIGSFDFYVVSPFLATLIS